METISVQDLWKRFRIYHRREETLKGSLAALVKGQRVIHEDFWALQGVSFGVMEGEAFGVIGENGSGKTTLLKILAGILRPNRGEIRMRGRIAALLELGAGFHPDLTGRENIFLNGAILGLPPREVRAQFDRIVSFAELERFIDTPVKHYSSGMYIRLGFAIAVHVDPDVLLVDEVLAVGDEAFQKKCLRRAEELKQAGKTILIVTHDLDMVEKFCARVAWLKGGVLAALGQGTTTIQLYRDDLARRAGETGG